MGTRRIVFIISIFLCTTLLSYSIFFQCCIQNQEFQPNPPLVVSIMIQSSSYSEGSTDKHYLSEQDIRSTRNDILNSSDPTNSKFCLLRNESIFKLGEEIKVRIDMYKSNGQRQLQGGDYLRVWMEDRYSGASVSGDVIDHKTGSYTAMLKAVWTGRASIKVFIANLREEIVLLYKLFQKRGSIWPIYAKYENDRRKYRCKTFLFKNELKCCNFTEINGDFPWFCKHPRIKGNNSCKYLTSYSSGKTPQLTNQEDKDIYQMSQDQSHAFFKQTIHIRITDLRTGHVPPLPACNKLPPQDTWARKHPNGYFRYGRWRSLLCSDTLDQSLEAYGNCLRGRTLWIPGDSTSLQVYKYFVRLFNGTVRKLPRHQPVSYKNSYYDFKIQWRPHEMSFFHGAKFVDYSVHRAEHLILRDLPNTSTDFIVLYLYVHFTLVHPAVFRRHVQKLVLEARALLERAPGVTVAVRGPHAFYKSLSMKKGLSSYWGLLYIDILHQEFDSLIGKVIFLDYWDLSVARASYSIHPDKRIISTMVHNMMSLMCFRDAD